MTIWEMLITFVSFMVVSAGFGCAGYVFGRSVERRRAFHLLDTRIRQDEKVRSCCKEALILSLSEVLTGTRKVLVHTRNTGYGHGVYASGVSIVDGGQEEKEEA